jgi:hypothetical protein
MEAGAVTSGNSVGIQDNPFTEKVAMLRQAASQPGKLAVPPFNPMRVTESQGQFLIESDNGTKVQVPVSATFASLTPAQKQAVAEVENLMTRSGLYGTTTPPVKTPDPVTGTAAGAPTETVTVEPKKQAPFKPAGNDFNARFDQSIARSGMQGAGANRHYLGAAEAQALCVCFGATSVQGLQSALNEAGATPPLAIDGKLGGKTLQAIVDLINTNKTFTFPAIGSADQAETYARLSELLTEHASAAMPPDQVKAFHAVLTGALAKAIAAAPADVQKAIGDRATAMASTGNAADPADAADAKAILTAAVVPPVAPAPKVAEMSATDLVAAMVKPGALDGDSGVAIRARLKDPTVLAAVVADPAALQQPLVAAEVATLIPDMDLATLAALTTTVGDKAGPDVAKVINARIDVLAGVLTATSDIGTLAKLRTMQKTLDPKAPVAPSLEKAAVAILASASKTELDGKDEGKPPFMDQLKAVFDGTLPASLTTAITDRHQVIKANGLKVKQDDRTELGKSAVVNDVYQQIVGKIKDGVQGKEDNDINAMIKAMGSVSQEGFMTAEGSAAVGALIERMMTTKANPDDAKDKTTLWDKMVKEFGGSERKDLLRILSHLPSTAMGSKAFAELARVSADRLGTDDEATKRIKVTFDLAFHDAAETERPDILRTVQGERKFTRSYVMDPKNFGALATTYPKGDIASSLKDAFDDDKQRVAFMNQLITVAADPRESEATRKWAMLALNDARVAFRQPLEDGDLSDVQTHLRKVNGGAQVPDDARRFLAVFHETLQVEKGVN